MFPVLFTIGGFPFHTYGALGALAFVVVSGMNWNPFSGRMENLPVFAFDEYKNPGVPPDPYLARAWAAALTLIAIVLLLNIAARLVYRRFGTELR